MGETPVDFGAVNATHSVKAGSSVFGKSWGPDYEQLGSTESKRGDPKPLGLPYGAQFGPLLEFHQLWLFTFAVYLAQGMDTLVFSSFKDLFLFLLDNQIYREEEK